MVPNDNNNFQDVFVVEVETGKVNVASFTDDGQPSNGDSPIEQRERVAISYDGSWIAFPTKATNQVSLHISQLRDPAGIANKNKQVSVSHK